MISVEDGPDKWVGFDPSELPEAVRFAATGGSRAERDHLLSLRKTVEEAARAHGFGVPGNRASHARFDTELGASFAEMSLLSSGEALRNDFWTFVGTSLAPDVVYWRFGAARARYLGGVRNTFQRLWLRARALDRGKQHPRRWQLLEALTEDALVQITERPSIGADPVLARAVAEAWLRARRHHGKGAMEPIMRRAALRVRIWNEIRSLADLPTDALAGVLDRAFGLFAESRPDENSAAESTLREVHKSPTSGGSGDGDGHARSPKGVVDSKLRRWEEMVRKNGIGTMRYKRFQAKVGLDGTSGALSGKIMNRDGWRIGMVTAATAAEFKREMKRTGRRVPRPRHSLSYYASGYGLRSSDAIEVATSCAQNLPSPTPNPSIPTSLPPPRRSLP